MGKGVVRLDFNENPYPPPKVIEVLKDALK